MSLGIRWLKDQNAGLKRDLETAVDMIELLLKYREFVLQSCKCDSREKQLLKADDRYEQLVKDCKFWQKKRRQKEVAEERPNSERVESDEEDEPRDKKAKTTQDNDYEEESSEDESEESESIQETTRNEVKITAKAAEKMLPATVTLSTIELDPPEDDDNRQRWRINWKSYQNDLHEEVETESGVRLKCLTCQRTYANFTQFKIHYKATHDLSAGYYKGKYQDFVDSSGQKRFQCLKCPKILKSYNMARTHFKNAHVIGTLICPHEGCGRKFKSEGGFKFHYESQHVDIEKTNEDIKAEEESSDGNETEDSDWTEEVTKKVTKNKAAKQQQMNWKKYQNDKHEEVETEFGKRIKCLECHMLYVNMYRFKHHYKVTHDVSSGSFKSKYFVIDSSGQKRFQCPECKKTLKTYNAVSIHYRSAHSGPHICSDCGRKYKSKVGLKQHYERKHSISDEKRKFSCHWPGCDQILTTKSGLNSHMLVHEGEKKYKCEWPGCDYESKYKGGLIEHAKRHNQEPTFACHWPGCTKMFYNEAKVRHHVKLRHMGVKKFKCDWPNCEFRASTSCAIKRHMTKHTQIRQFACTWPGCDKKYLTKSNMDYHLEVHKGVRPFKCQVEGCGSDFVYAAALRTHVQMVHEKTWKKRVKKSDK